MWGTVGEFMMMSTEGSTQRDEDEQLKQVQNLKEQNAKLKAIITKGSTNDNEPLDSDNQIFLRAKRSHSKIVHKHNRMNGTIHLETKSRNPYLESQKKFFHGFQPDMPDSLRKYRTRAKVFVFVFGDILDFPCFGVGEELETDLAAFEIDLKTSKKVYLSITTAFGYHSNLTVSRKHDGYH